jgi:hypothetical protein
MRDNMRDQLNTEITRKQFLQYLGGALLMVFGFHNLFSLLTGGRAEHHVWHQGAPIDTTQHGFGSRKFGV